jgi:potassium efflux system protein
LLTLALTAFGQAGSVRAQESTALDRLTGDRKALERMIVDVQSAIDRRSSQNQALSEELSAATSDPAQTVSLRQLDQLQFDVDIARARLVTLDNRTAHQRGTLAILDEEIRETESRLADLPEEALSTLVEEVALDLRRKLAETIQTYTDALEAFRGLSAVHLSLNLEQLALMRDRIELASVVDRASLADDPRVRALRVLIDSLVRDNIELSNQAAGMAAQTDAEAERRNRMQMRADEALMRSTARLTDLDIVETREIIRRLNVLADNDAVPERLLSEAITLLGNLRQGIELRQENLTQQRYAVANLVDLARAETAARGSLPHSLEARLRNLAALIDVQDREMSSALARVDQLDEAFEDQIVRRSREDLLTRQAIRHDAATLSRVQADLHGIPSQTLRLLDGTIREAGGAVIRASWQTVALYLLAAALMVGVIYGGLRPLLGRYVRANPNLATSMPVEVLRRNLLWALPLGLWLLAVAIFGLSREVSVFVGTLLGIPPLAMIVRDALQVQTVSHLEGRRRIVGRRLIRLLDASLALILALVVAYLLMAQMDLLPSTRAWISRAVFVCLLAASAPLFLFAAFFLRFGSAGREGGGRSQRGLGLLSLLIPIGLIAVGALGLAGYATLAKRVVIDATKLVAIITALWLVLGILRDGLRIKAHQLAEAYPGNSFFWKRNFVEPLYRLCQVALTIVAGLVLFEVFGWNRTTPVVRQVIAVFQYPLFRLGDTPHSVGDVVTVVIMVLLVFWIGGWSRHVSYTLAFRRIRDIGIRQSLSVFTQYVVIVVGLLLALSLIGFDVTTLTVFAASLGVGIGFGMQNVVNNFISGLLLLIERPLKLGDVVTVDGESGTVRQIGIRSLKIRTFDEKDIIVPNSAVISDKFTNWTGADTVARQLHSVGIGYDDDPTRAIEIIDGILAANEDVLRYPDRSVTVSEFGDSAIVLRVAYHIDTRTTDIFKIGSDVLTEIWSQFRAEGITIPYPQRSLHFAEPDGTMQKTLQVAG